MGTKKVVQSMIEKGKGSEAALTKALMNANEVAAKGMPKKDTKKKKK